MTLSHQNPERRSEDGSKKSTRGTEPAASSADTFQAASLPARGLTQAEADAYIEQLPAVRHERALREKLDLSVCEIGLSEAHSNLLVDKGIFTVEDLLNRKESELRALGRNGDGTMRDIRECLQTLGFQFRQSSKPAKD